MAFRGAMRIASCFIGLALAEIWRTTARRLCVLLSQADSERALPGRDHNLVLARQPTDGPVEEGAFAFTWFFSCVRDNSPWVLSAWQIAPAVLPISSSIVIRIPQHNPHSANTHVNFCRAWLQPNEGSGRGPLP